jgi:predicted DNA-binding transcriptional regulator AlpA
MPKGKTFPHGYFGITREHMEQAAREGMISQDACEYLGVSRRTFYNYRKKWPDIKFPNCAQAGWIARRGYAGR